MMNTFRKLASALPLIFFGFVFSAFSCFFLYMAYMVPLQQQNWMQTTGIVESQTIIEDADLNIQSNKSSVIPELVYTYTINGVTYHSDNFGKSIPRFSEEAQAYNQNYKVGTQIQCFYNPEDPTESAVFTTMPTKMFLIIPVLFFLIGLGIMVMGVRSIFKKGAPNTEEEIDDERRFVKRTQTEGPPVTPKSKPQKEFTMNSKYAWIAYPFLAIFPVVYSIFFLYPYVQASEMEHWVATPCTILESRVESSSSGKHGTTYTPIVLYKYEVDSHRYGGSKIAIGPTNSSEAGDICNFYEKGKQFTCYYNPDNPEEAILNKKYRLGGGGILFGVFFVGFPIGCAAFLIWRQCKKDTSSNTVEHIQTIISDTQKNVVQKIQESAVGKKFSKNLPLLSIVIGGIIFLFVLVPQAGFLISFFDNFGIQKYFYEKTYSSVIALPNPIDSQKTNFTVRYYVDETPYEHIFNVSKISTQNKMTQCYHNNDSFPLFYDAKNPKTVILNKPPIMIVIIPFIILIIILFSLGRIITSIIATIKKHSHAKKD